MHAFDVLGDPVRRRILELLADGEQTAGALTDAVRAEFGISQPAVSQHLKVLRETGFATVRPEGTRRLYAVNPAALSEVDQWLDRFRAFWSQRMDVLETELARGARAARLERAGGSDRSAERGRREARPRPLGDDVPSQTRRRREVARQRRAERQTPHRRNQALGREDQTPSRRERRETA